MSFYCLNCSFYLLFSLPLCFNHIMSHFSLHHFFKFSALGKVETSLLSMLQMMDIQGQNSEQSLSFLLLLLLLIVTSVGPIYESQGIKWQCNNQRRVFLSSVQYLSETVNICPNATVSHRSFASQSCVHLFQFTISINSCALLENNRSTCVSRICRWWMDLLFCFINEWQQQLKRRWAELFLDLVFEIMLWTCYTLFLSV